MARSLPATAQVAYSELIERCQVDQVDRIATEYPLTGGFVTQRQGERAYWYFQATGDDGKRRQTYIGADTPELRQHIETHQALKSDMRDRRQIISTLRRVGLPAPDPLSGRILDELAAHGAFRMRAVLVGTMAYQCYSGLLGTKLNAANLTTSDLDIAQFEQVSIAVGDQIDLPFQALLQRVDPGFRSLPDLADPRRATRFALGDRYRVDLLTPNRGPDSEAPVFLPALQADAQPLRYLDFLIRDEVQAVILHGNGVLVNVPAPERYAVHKLIVSRLRLQTSESQSKSRKDLRQAAELIGVLAEHRPFELKDVWEEMSGRGPKWRSLAIEAATLLPENIREQLRQLVGGTGAGWPLPGTTPKG